MMTLPFSVYQIGQNDLDLYAIVGNNCRSAAEDDWKFQRRDMTMAKKHAVRLVTLFCAAITLAGFAPRAIADDEDPPSRVARLAYAQGSVSFQPAGTDDWVSAVVNRPMTTGDKLWSDNDGRVEMQLDSSLLRISNSTGVSFLNLSDNVTQIQLSAGTLLVRVLRLNDNETYEIDTPNLAFSILRPGLYRLSVDEAGQTTVVKVRAGQGEVTGGGTAYTVHANEYDTFSGTDQLDVNVQQHGADEDQFDSWSANRDTRSEHSTSARYVSQDVVGYEDLDDHGSWRQTPEYGNVWFPRAEATDWAPYHNGHWAYIEPWGYTWVDDEPWGFAPFHYGRWVSLNGAWGWVPSPPRNEREVYVRPVYAPALVAWVTVGGGVAWFPLGPREVYVPSYPVSRNYVNNINVSNTTVNTTVVNNYYNTTIVNKNVAVTNVKYVNQGVPGAVTATSSQAFTTAQPVANNAVKVDQHAMASAPVRAFTPAAVPAKQSVLGTQRAAAKPPAAVESRVVVAKVAPPPPPPVFEKRQEAIKNNGGQPLSVAQVRQIQPTSAQRAAFVKIAPPAKAATPQTAKVNRPENKGAAENQPAAVQPAYVNKPNQPEPNKPVTQASRPENRPADRPATVNNAVESLNKPETPVPVKAVTPNNPTQPANRSTDRPANANNAAPHVDANRPAPPAIHPNELPPVPKPVPPNPANPQLEQKHQQEQDQLRVKQEAERQKVQQQQELEHQQLAQQKADEAKKQLLEQQHQQQTQQLQQQHVQEQQKLQEKQKQEKQQQKPSNPPKNDRPPQP
jgi:Family of unknown function (DUF6600)